MHHRSLDGARRHAPSGAGLLVYRFGREKDQGPMKEDTERGAGNGREEV
jgi:hypothetical protein